LLHAVQSEAPPLSILPMRTAIVFAYNVLTAEKGVYGMQYTKRRQDTLCGLRRLFVM